MSASDRLFAGSIPELYETCLVPLIFAPYAADLARRIAVRQAGNLLEIAAGTGVVTRALAAAMPAELRIVATDLNPAMLEQAAASGTPRPVEWRQADALALPFPDHAFDAVVCQFGVMFFPDKAAAFAEARRVLKPDGQFVFNVWDRIETNEFAETVTQSLAQLFPDDPPRFLARTPHGYHDPATIARDLAGGGFVRAPRVETLSARSRASSAHEAAFAYCQGTPLRNEIEARAADRLDAATAHAADAIRRRFGSAGVDGRIQALVVTVEA